MTFLKDVWSTSQTEMWCCCAVKLINCLCWCVAAGTCGLAAEPADGPVQSGPTEVSQRSPPTGDLQRRLRGVNTQMQNADTHIMLQHFCYAYFKKKATTTPWLKIADWCLVFLVNKKNLLSSVLFWSLMLIPKLSWPRGRPASGSWVTVKSRDQGACYLKPLGYFCFLKRHMPKLILDSDVHTLESRCLPYAGH